MADGNIIDSPEFEEIMEPTQYWWQTPEYIAKQKKVRLRNILASDVKENTIYPATDGYCIWCGKEVKTGRRFCAGIRREAKEWEKIYFKRDYMLDYPCTNAFMNWWSSIPKFKRAVFLRDNFTCQICGLKPTWINKHGVVLPDLSQLACDHIYPFAKGGKTEHKNLQCLCRKCNYRKSDKVDYKPSAQLNLNGILAVD